MVKKKTKRLRPRALAKGEMLKAADLPANAKVIAVPMDLSALLEENRQSLEVAFNDWLAATMGSPQSVAEDFRIRADFMEQRTRGDHPAYGIDQVNALVKYVKARES